jgi:hypothetical protein
MKQTIITALLALVALTGRAQQIKVNEPSISDYLPLLEAMGYKAYSFDTKEFKGATAQTVVMEYVKGQEPREVSGFSMSVDLDEKLIIGFVPSDNDSIARYVFRFDDVRGVSSRLYLKPICDPQHPEEKWYMYNSRPFELTAPIEKGKFIPLVLYGSHWYDADCGACRFCGDNFIKPDFSSDIVKYIPHFFVLGIKIL